MRKGEYPFECYAVPGAENVRDIGGYAGEEGAPVKKRRFIRAGAMHRLTDEGVRAVRELGVRCIVDLRSRFEARRMPDTLAGDDAIAYVHIPMLDYIQSNIAEGLTTFPSSMEEMYIGLLDRDKESFLRLLQVFGDPAYPTILFHCTAGKDRTGLSAMLLLGLAGVSREDIVTDYSYSERLVSGPIMPGVPRYLFESKPLTMETALSHLDARYGGIHGYLDTIGVSTGLKRRIREKLFD